MTDKLQLRCGNCAWYRNIVIPEEMQPEGFTPRGQCYAVPPTVYPVPVPKQSRLAIAQGQEQKMEVAPAMLRPIVEEDDNMCGSYAPNALAREALEKIQAQRQAGCGDKTCNKEECDCG